ncbi:uncharacterized protein LOC135825073 [Sycon ciliatum]|uniref:uncharacterized protein LOC135825073 n=1 Tax=Sycon ciliatum TaxID=27933 RepID=UPI0031F6C142
MASKAENSSRSEAKCSSQDSGEPAANGSASAQASLASGRADQVRNIPEAVCRLRDLLVEKYVSATVDMGEGMVEEGLNEPRVSDVQVRLIILSRPELRDQFSRTNFDSIGDVWRVEHVFTQAATSLENISLESLFDLDKEQMLEFSSGGRTYRILVVASAGCGKTFALTKVAPLKWAQEEMWTSFDLVVARKLRHKEVRKARNICSLLGVEELGEFTSDERKSIDGFVRQQAQRVCLVLDGLDEIRLSECSGFVRDIINGSNVKGLRLVVTSRPCVELLSLCDQKQFDRRVELVGFRQDDVEEYIEKVLRSAEEASALVTAVRLDQNLASMMATPFLAMQTCKIFHCRKRTLPRCLSDIFEMMTIQVAERHTDEPYKNWNTIPARVRSLILDLGKFSFSMLRKQQLIFTDADLEARSIAREAKSLGLLVLADNSSRDKDRLWMFSHLTLQESLAARYVAVHKTTTLAHVVHLVESLGPQTSHLRTFWMLLTAQLDGEKADCLINGLLTRVKSEERDEQNWDGESEGLADTAALETFPLDLLEPLSAGLDQYEIHRLSEELLSDRIDGRSGEQYVENRSKYGRSSSGEQFLSTMLLAWVDRCPDATPATLATALGRMGKEVLAQSLTAKKPDKPLLQNNPFHNDITEEHRGNLHLAVLCYAEYSHHHGNDTHPMSSIAAAFQCMGVRIWGTYHPALMRAYDVAINVHHSSVRTVYIRSLQPNHPVSLPASLLKCSNIIDLLLERCSWQWQEILLVIKSSHLQLEKIWVVYGDFSDASRSSVASHPVHTQPAQATRSGEVTTSEQVTGNPALLLANALADVPRLQEFTLSNCGGIDQEGLRMICTALHSASHLSEIHICQSHWAHCINVLTENLHTAWPCLTVLVVGVHEEPLHCSLTDDDATAFLHAINSHTSLQKLAIFANHTELASVDACKRLFSSSSYRSSLDKDLCLE